MYKIFEQLLQKRNVTPYKIAKEADVTQTALSNWKSGRSIPSTKTLKKIANYLHVSLEDLTNENENLITCFDCGLTYDNSCPEDVETHIEQHTAWEKAVKKFGKIYGYEPEREQIKAENRNISHDLSLPLEERCEAQIRVLRCLFSRSLVANSYSLDHVPFDTYVAMMLNNPSYQKYNLEDDLKQALIDKYGTAPGINSGTIYHIPKKSRAISKKDKRDIKRDLDRIMEQLSNQEYGPAAYDGEELSPEAAELFRDELEIALKRLKLINKEKYNPHKNKK